MKNIVDRMNSFIYYQICEEYPITEYIIGVSEGIEETKHITRMCECTFSPLETARLFIARYARIIISIAITSLFWTHYGRQIATSSFYASSMPNWMLYFGLFGGMEITTTKVF